MRDWLQRLAFGCLTSPRSRKGHRRDFVREPAPVRSRPTGEPDRARGAPSHEPRGVAITNDGGHTRAWVVDYGTPGLAVFDLSHTPAVQESFLAARRIRAADRTRREERRRRGRPRFDRPRASHFAVYRRGAARRPDRCVRVGGPPKRESPAASRSRTTSAVLVTDHSRNTLPATSIAGAESPADRAGAHHDRRRKRGLRMIHIGAPIMRTPPSSRSPRAGRSICSSVRSRVQERSRTIDVGLRPETVSAVRWRRHQIMVAGPGSDSVGDSEPELACHTCSKRSCLVRSTSP